MSNHRLAHYKRAQTVIFWHPKPDDVGQGWIKRDRRQRIRTTLIMRPYPPSITC